MEKKVGMICLATDQGLGYLAKDFYMNGIVEEVYVHPHSSRKNHYEWYPNRCTSIEQLLNKIDILFLIETPFEWKVIPMAREKGIKTVFMVMYECTRSPLPYSPDVILCPSKLDLQYYKEGREVVVPVDVKWKLREKAQVFVHNAGNGGLGGRNGTKELIEAFNHVKSDARLILRSQVPIKCNNPKIDLRIGTFDDIWSEGDVFIFPEKFNGLSLPLQEAFASGMMVMCGDRFPMNTWLPREPLIPVKGYHKERIAVEFDCAEFDPFTIAENIDKWYNKDITELSLKGKEFNNKFSWKKQKEIYRALMSQL